MAEPGPEIFPVKREWLPRVILVAAVLLLVLALLGVWLNFRPRPFDSARWQSSGGIERGQMLASLLAQTNFVGLTRASVEANIGPANFDERQFWYDLGTADPAAPVDPRAAVGDSTHLYAVFSFDRGGAITSALYNHRRPVLGSKPFDSIVWGGPDHAIRRGMFVDALGRLRAAGGMSRAAVESLLGRPDGARIRAQYDVGAGGTFFGSQKALILEYDTTDVVQKSSVVP